MNAQSDGRIDAERGDRLSGQLFRIDAKPAASHASVLQNLIHDAAHHVDWDREADAVGPERLRKNRRVDPDELAFRIDERSARISEVDGGIGLDEILEIRDAESPSTGRAHDSLRHGLTQSERIADGEHDISGADLVRSAHGHE